MEHLYSGRLYLFEEPNQNNSLMVALYAKNEELFFSYSEVKEFTENGDVLEAKFFRKDENSFWLSLIDRSQSQMMDSIGSFIAENIASLHYEELEFTIFNLGE